VLHHVSVVQAVGDLVVLGDALGAVDVEGLHAYIGMSKGYIHIWKKMEMKKYEKKCEKRRTGGKLKKTRHIVT
jgi:hypothetical protein